MNARLAALAAVCLVAGSATLHGQPRVDSRNLHERVLAVVPMIGKGTFDDPRRPMYAPAPAQAQAEHQALKPGAKPGIIEFRFQESDDHKFALVEFVAVDKEALKPILDDKSIKSFLKGRDKRDDAELEFKKYKSDFDINKLIGVTPVIGVKP
jgi:hypothetical protein